MAEMDTDEGKLFIGGISWETTEEDLKDYFSKYGEVLQAIIMKDKSTGRPRGFGFVAFADPSVLDHVLQDKHVIDGRNVEAKRALSREGQHTSVRFGNHNAGRATGGDAGGNMRTKKIFVGGLPPTLTEDEFRQYFATYGTVTDVVVMFDQATQRPRGFGFISFDSEDAVDQVLHKTFHDLSGKHVEVKRALPKDANPNSRSTGGGTYPSYGGSGANAGSYDGRADANGYMQPQAAGGGYPGYGSSGYAGPGYGYGAANNGVGYGSYGMGGYGSASAGAYGNPNAPGGGYTSGPPGAPRGPWNNQAASGFTPAGYGGNTGYGSAASWGAPAAGGGNIAASTGQSPSGTGFGNQGYGYGGNDGSYTSQGGYGAVGRRGGIGGPTGNAAGSAGDQATGYMSGYGDANGNSGYPNYWRSDPSQGGAYGAA